MIRLVHKLIRGKDAVMQWQTQAGNIITNLKVKIDITLPTLSTMNVVTWKCHMGDSSNGRYNMILGRDLLTELGLNLKISNHSIKYHDRPSIGATAPTVDLGRYVFKDLNTGKIKLKESLTDAYSENYISENIYVL